jgi:hypothetical protein
VEDQVTANARELYEINDLAFRFVPTSAYACARDMDLLVLNKMKTCSNKRALRFD